MARIRTDELAPDMELGADVSDLNQRLLFRAGTVLTDNNIRLLKTWGVVDVEIGGEAPLDSMELNLMTLPPETRERVERETEELFRHTSRKHPAVESLHRESLRRAFKTALMTHAS